MVVGKAALTFLQPVALLVLCLDFEGLIFEALMWQPPCEAGWLTGCHCC